MNKLKQFIEGIEKKHRSQNLQPEDFIRVNKNNTKQAVIMFEMASQISLKGKKILDVGFGAGDALELFVKEGASPIGICINQEEVDLARKKGYEAYKMNQNFMTFEDETFDVVWSRHCLEHSLMPRYTLHEYKRVLKDGGFLYVEVPAPETKSHQEDNLEHFSLFTLNVWTALMKRELEVVSSATIFLEGPNGRDANYLFILKKAVCQSLTLSAMAFFPALAFVEPALECLGLS